ncbi:aminopeptidase N [Corynebacterium sp. P7202]|uniref:Aminopeptidase N n=1 Tax=Corynebacterium pygosceleis TaxID=2800406 RepID=A0A9Q4GMG9_9CORY|nr:aminopeptidase N [Corynebacterium pygosceleis]MCK7636406.1 aminopeptidase N [Corynebacterium pygosceleis]MCX7469280.1 aminopeptidase N [Corynebacterium pygosceleis]
MTSTNLTRAEARKRSSILGVDNYGIVLDLTGGETEFSSVTTVDFTVSTSGDTFIDLRASRVSEVLLDGGDITADAVTLGEDGYDENAGIALNGLEPGAHTLRITADCRYSRTGQGLHRFVDPADNEVYMYTQFETADAKRMFACFDQPDLKATYDLTITTPTGWRVISNADQTVTDNGDGTSTHASRIDYRLSTYLVAICVGPYHEVRDEWTGELTHHPETPADQPHELTVPMGLYCRRSLADSLDAERLFTETKQGFDFYHANFGVAYPFHKYDQIFVPEFNMGAMENAGCVTHRDEYVFTSKVNRYRYERRCDTVLHELAHMWFGDLVTMRWWDDLWLNESFATWSAAISQAEATEYESAWVTFANIEKSWAYSQDQLPSTHPITTDASDIETVEQNFDGITYAKGASVLKQLAAYVGREEFFAGVRRHFATHSFGNATFDDLLEALEAASGRDLSDWANQWLKTTGVNTLAAEFEVSGDRYVSFGVRQQGAEPGAGELRDHRVAVGLYSLIDGVVRRVRRVELDVSGEFTEVPDLIGVERADLVLVNDDDLTYCLTHLDSGSLDFVLHNIARIEDPMPRTLCWSATWEMVRDGRMRARDFINLVASGASAETEIAVLERILTQASSALSGYADPAWAEETGGKLLADALLDGARTAEPGSDAQLTFLQVLSRRKLGPDTPAQIDVFTQLRDGASPIDGLEVDNDLRWRALTALIAAGEITDADAAIEAELARDSSSDSQKWAWAAHAAVNTPERKKEIFDEVTDPGSGLSNLSIRHKIEGLTWAGSAPNLGQFNEAYFELAPGFWRTATPEMALAALNGLYPSWDITREGVARAGAFLDGEHPTGLKRVVSEGRDRVQRALRNRAVDADGSPAN